MASALELRDGFQFRLPLDADALWERLAQHPRIRIAHDPAPEPAPPEGAPFLIARQSEGEFRLRHWAGPADAASPVVIMKLEPDGKGHTLVRGHFENRSRQRRLVDLPRLRRGGGAFITGSVIVTVLAIALLAPVLIGAPLNMVVSVLALLFFFTIPTALVFVPGLLIWNAEGRKRFIGPLWELVGEVMLPIALPESTGDRPFRGHALPSAGD